jgi:plasmid maintenance system antidote protein VapI
LAKYFGVSARFWLGIQDDYDLEEEQQNKPEEFDRIPTVTA